MKRQNKKIIIMMDKQGRILRKFKDPEQFFEILGHSKLTIYFKISLYKFFTKHPFLKKSMLSSHYSKNIFK